MTRIENVGVFIREMVWLENSLSQTISLINIPKLSNVVIFHTYTPMKIKQTECGKTSAYKIQTPGNYLEESIQNS
jgi:Holliday junction resolvasome RuvABC endonuclease subunit